MPSEIFQLQSMLNVIKCIDQRFAFKNSGISCLALILHLKNLWLNLWTHGLVVKVSCSESGKMGSIAAGC